MTEGEQRANDHDGFRSRMVKYSKFSLSQSIKKPQETKWELDEPKVEENKETDDTMERKKKLIKNFERDQKKTIKEMKKSLESLNLKHLNKQRKLEEKMKQLGEISYEQLVTENDKEIRLYENEIRKIHEHKDKNKKQLLSNREYISFRTQRGDEFHKKTALMATEDQPKSERKKLQPKSMFQKSIRLNLKKEKIVSKEEAYDMLMREKIARNFINLHFKQQEILKKLKKSKGKKKPKKTEDEVKSVNSTVLQEDEFEKNVQVFRVKILKKPNKVSFLRSNAIRRLSKKERIRLSTKMINSLLAKESGESEEISNKKLETKPNVNLETPEESRPNSKNLEDFQDSSEEVNDNVEISEEVDDNEESSSRKIDLRSQEANEAAMIIQQFVRLFINAREQSVIEEVSNSNEESNSDKIVSQRQIDLKIESNRKDREIKP